ncbi:MAG: TerB family tellurite resistance protein [Pseudomonadota bacterium]|nr:TerB family tellurite resistance protein [Pseudomonadota bacterium]
MLDALRTLFSPDEAPVGSADREDKDLPLAAAALLLEVGYADAEIREDELEAISTALRNRFGFTESSVQTLIEDAHEQHQGEHSMYPFLSKVNKAFSPSRKVHLIADMWRVAYADRRLDKHEEHRIRKISALLHVPHRDFIRAKLEVREELGID